MLVLSRKAGESIIVDDVKVTVVKLDRNRVRIGIEAPEDKKILRGELVIADLMDELTADEPNSSAASEPVPVGR